LKTRGVSGPVSKRIHNYVAKPFSKIGLEAVEKVKCGIETTTFFHVLLIRLSSLGKEQKETVSESE